MLEGLVGSPDVAGRDGNVRSVILTGNGAASHADGDLKLMRDASIRRGARRVFLTHVPMSTGLGRTRS